MNNELTTFYQPLVAPKVTYMGQIQISIFEFWDEWFTKISYSQLTACHVS